MMTNYYSGYKGLCHDLLVAVAEIGGLRYVQPSLLGCLFDCVFPLSRSRAREMKKRLVLNIMVTLCILAAMTLEIGHRL